MSCKRTQTGKLSRTNAVWSSLGDRILGDFYLYCVLCLYTSYNTHSIFHSVSFVKHLTMLCENPVFRYFVNGA